MGLLADPVLNGSIDHVITVGFSIIGSGSVLVFSASQKLFQSQEVNTTTNRTYFLFVSDSEQSRLLYIL